MMAHPSLSPYRIPAPPPAPAAPRERHDWCSLAAGAVLLAVVLILAIVVAPIVLMFLVMLLCPGRWCC
jgi:hypothetical protein